MAARSYNILGIAGSLRRASYNRAVLRAAQSLTLQDATLEIFEIDGIPGFCEDVELNPPPKVVELKAKVRGAEAILFVTPEYNYSIPGVLKNAIDWTGLSILNIDFKWQSKNETEDLVTHHKSRTTCYFPCLERCENSVSCQFRKSPVCSNSVNK